MIDFILTKSTLSNKYITFVQASKNYFNLELEFLRIDNESLLIEVYLDAF